MSDDDSSRRKGWSSWKNIRTILFPSASANQATKQSAPPPKLPRIAPSRLSASLNDDAFDLGHLDSALSGLAEKKNTILYLAYGSNLAHSTFQGRRGIRPLAAINVVVPTLRLTFDLPGVPYTEPCFANSSRRDPAAPPPPQPPRYHKDRWQKGMVGVVYEVTPDDYAHIIATEGAGSSYQDVVVECYALSPNPSAAVPSNPAGAGDAADTPLQPFKAHTLFVPDEHSRKRPAHRDPSYAQPSARYLGLLTTGAAEHDLPFEYRAYLGQIRPYTITTARQRVGKFVTATVWGPWLLLVFGLTERFKDERGRAPRWLAWLMKALFAAVWGSYDGGMRWLFGDGERTMYEHGDEAEEGEEEQAVVVLDEKRSRRRSRGWSAGDWLANEMMEVTERDVEAAQGLLVDVDVDGEEEKEKENGTVIREKEVKGDNVE